jgi:hypothetical protein
LVRAGALKIILGQKEYSNPSDRDLIDALRVANKFNKAELVLEETEVDPEVLTETRKFVMKLAKKRGIDETPAAISEAAESLAMAVLAKAGDVKLWANGSDLPLPTAFIEGVDAWQQVRDLTNPIHRVNELHASHIPLHVGHETIEQYAAFQTQNATPFKELRELVQKLEAVEHRLDVDSTMISLLGDYRAAVSACSFATKEAWNSLQSRKAQALLELTPLLDRWRQEARSMITAALDRLPTELQERELDPSLEQSLSQPLLQLRDGLDASTLPSQVASFPERSRGLVRNLGQRIADEVARKQKEHQKKNGKGDGSKTSPPSPARHVRMVRATEVATITRVSSETEWDQLKAKLDQRVRQLLADGFDVELG